nr:peptidase M56 [Bacillus pseudomycoides]
MNNMCKKNWKPNKINSRLIRMVSVSLIVFSMIGCTQAKSKPSNKESAKEETDMANIPINSKLDSFITESIISWNKERFNHTEKQFETHLLYGTEEVDGKIHVYLHSLLQGYKRETGDVAQAGHFLPVRVTVRKHGDEYVLEDYKEPYDGEQNEPSLRKMFPNKYADQALNVKNDTVHSLEKQMGQSVNKWLNEE